MSHSKVTVYKASSKVLPVNTFMSIISLNPEIPSPPLKEHNPMWLFLASGQFYLQCSVSEVRICRCRQSVSLTNMAVLTLSWLPAVRFKMGSFLAFASQQTMLTKAPNGGKQTLQHSCHPVLCSSGDHYPAWFSMFPSCNMPDSNDRKSEISQKINKNAVWWTLRTRVWHLCFIAFFWKL